MTKSYLKVANKLTKSLVTINVPTSCTSTLIDLDVLQLMQYRQMKQQCSKFQLTEAKFRRFNSLAYESRT